MKLARWEREYHQALESKFYARFGRQARNRAERWRMLDPIHVYCQDELSGEYTLVLDYHKGAHALSLEEAVTPGGAQRLRVTENDLVFEFDLVCPAKLGTMSLPLVPQRLCKGF